MVNDLKYCDSSVQQIDRIPDELKQLYATTFEVDARWLVKGGSSLTGSSKALANPNRVEIDRADDSLLHVLYPVPERAFRVLRVIYDEATEPVSVVTAYFDDEGKDL